jgi:uncharacterized protein with HEPN domain
MNDEIIVWLNDILKSIAEINLFIPAEKNFLLFQNDLKTRRAVERNLEIIGEALNKVLKKYPDIPISNSRKIVDTRNRIIHGYDSVSYDIVWLIYIRYLPKLQSEIENLVKL